MEKEIEIIKWANQPNVLVRNEKAKAYSKVCEDKRKARKVNIVLGTEWGFPLAVLVMAMLILNMIL